MPSLFLLASSVIVSLSLSAAPGRAATPTRTPVASVVCGAAPPRAGTVFSGPVLHVFDGRTLCVAQGPTPSEWVRVTLAGESPGGTRANLMAAAFARRVLCHTDHANQLGVVARCALDDGSLDLLTESRPVEAAAWR